MRQSIEHFMSKREQASSRNTQCTFYRFFHTCSFSILQDSILFFAVIEEPRKSTTKFSTQNDRLRNSSIFKWSGMEKKQAKKSHKRNQHCNALFKHHLSDDDNLSFPLLFTQAKYCSPNILGPELCATFPQGLNVCKFQNACVQHAK